MRYSVLIWRDGHWKEYYSSNKLKEARQCAEEAIKIGITNIRILNGGHENLKLRSLKMQNKKPDMALQIMLSKVFDKTFYKTFSPKLCKHCEGEGEIEVERCYPQSFDNDIGYLGTTQVECDECKGTGQEEVSYYG